MAKAQNKKLKIYMIGQKGIPKSGELGGGIETHVEAVATRLAAHGHRVFVYVRPWFQKERTRKYNGVTLLRRWTFQSKNLEAIIHTFICTLDVLGRDVDIIHYHGVGPSTLAWIPRLFKKSAKVLVTFHSQDRFHKKWGLAARFYLAWGEWTACHFPHYTIAVSQNIAIYCARRFKREAVYIPNGVEPGIVRRSDELEQFGVRPDGYFLVVARLVQHKGIHYLIQAYQGLKTQKKLVIVGAPSFSSQYLKFLEALAEGNRNIIFAGFRTGDTLRQLFAHCYTYVHPSESEGLSITILEAMSFGKCVLISDIPENLETIDHSGFSFRSGNVTDLRQKMEYLLANPAMVKHKGARAKKFIGEFFNWEKIVESIEGLYRR
ncbi:MAG: glycosyltransferase family 4 protein [Patescibacteria group bacterium]|nr:glycosyltransferase family 4 protein [Patescibacteria group bacterium]